MNKIKDFKNDFIMKFIKNNREKIIILCITSMIISFIGIYIPVIASKSIDYIIDINNVDMQSIIKYLIIIAILTIVSSILEYVMNFMNNKMAVCIGKKYRNDLSKKINELEMSYIDSSAKGDIASRIINDTESVVEGFLLVISKGVTGIFTALFTIIFILKINLKMGLLVIILTPISIFVSKIIINLIKKYFKEEAEYIGKELSYLNEIINNHKNVVAYTNEEKVIEKFEAIDIRFEEISIKAKFYSSLTNPFSRFINNIIYAIITILGAQYVLNGILTIGELTAFLNYASKYNKPFNDISEVISEIETAFSRLDRINEILNEKNDIDNGKEKLNLSYLLENNKIDDIISFDKVSFGYTKDINILKDISFNIKNNQKIAIVGHTGCGKTTLINLLMRYYEINSGNIFICGVNIKEYTKKSYRKNFGMVLQSPYIKMDTIMNNLKMGNEEITDEEVINISKKTKCYNFVSKLPNGFDTMIQNDNSLLSEGEKQLIAITRVMIANPQILILDEATSNIDSRTEIIVQEAFDQLMKDKTSIIIAHRLSTIKSADKILVMADGKIVEEGKEMDLLNKKGYYYELQNSQS